MNQEDVIIRMHSEAEALSALPVDVDSIHKRAGKRRQRRLVGTATTIAALAAIAIPFTINSNSSDIVTGPQDVGSLSNCADIVSDNGRVVLESTGTINMARTAAAKASINLPDSWNSLSKSTAVVTCTLDLTTPTSSLPAGRATVLVAAGSSEPWVLNSGEAMLSSEPVSVRWRLRTGFNPSAETTSIPVQFRETRCASGQTANERLQDPHVRYSSTEVRIGLTLTPPPTGGRCPQNPLTVVTVQLTEPVGNRRVVDIPNGDLQP